MNEYTNERLPCDTMRIGENIASRSYGIATPHGSNLRDAINIVVLEMADIGFLEQLKQKWYYQRSECTIMKGKESKQTTALNLIDVASIFYILIIGVVFGIIIAFFEFFRMAKLDSIRLNQNISQVMRRNLRISIMGSDLVRNEEAKRIAIGHGQSEGSSEEKRLEDHRGK